VSVTFVIKSCEFRILNFDATHKEEYIYNCFSDDRYPFHFSRSIKFSTPIPICIEVQKLDNMQPYAAITVHVKYFNLTLKLFDFFFLSHT
jgi:hypothetical protein